MSKHDNVTWLKPLPTSHEAHMITLLCQRCGKREFLKLPVKAGALEAAKALHKDCVSTATPNLPCTMGHDKQDIRQNPDNKAVAFSYTLHDLTGNLRSMGMARNHHGVINTLDQIETLIRQLREVDEKEMFKSTKI